MRDWPKAPRVCLLDRIACSCTTCPASDWMLPCAVSMTASRSCSLARLSCVDLRLLGHGLAEPAGHGVEALADRLRELGLPCAEHIGDRAHAALHLGLRLA